MFLIQCPCPFFLGRICALQIGTSLSLFSNKSRINVCQINTQLTKCWEREKKWNVPQKRQELRMLCTLIISWLAHGWNFISSVKMLYHTSKVSQDRMGRIINVSHLKAALTLSSYCWSFDLGLAIMPFLWCHRESQGDPRGSYLPI